ncbi:hypothetical protein FB567DRAFT_580786 [Paraphoma chrysanthemicola]|uniref:Uncharacterized protein n=1 Tax=Paraphoma chrysanthemicola TaxID=798071 RepID=A0A8K0R2W9_9PLEO|nr:hypothetical protein FB567DRAFT_580786 [Paraphoma chrysanthemicola]
MNQIATLALTLIPFPTWAYPTEAIVSHSSLDIAKRNPCDGVNAEPVLYHDYKGDVCPPPFTFTSPGQCQMKRYKPKGNIFQHLYCGGYCEENVRFFYGREVMFLASPYCHGPMTCTITDTETTAWAFSISFPQFSAKLTEIFTAGITGSISSTTSTAKAIAKAVKLEQNECGYFTWIPILRESCGTFTGEGDFKDIAPGHPEGLCYDGKLVEPNTCVTVPNAVKGTKGDPWGITTLVRVDCRTHEPLPAEFQDPAYNNPGVPLDRGLYQSFAETFEDSDKIHGQTSEIDCNIQDVNQLANREDCSAAIATGMLTPVVALLAGRKDGQWWASSVHSCALQIEYEQDWTDDCFVGLTEVLRAAAGIMNTCKAHGDKIGGARRFRNDGRCNATLRLANTAGRDRPQDASPLLP